MKEERESLQMNQSLLFTFHALPLFVFLISISTLPSPTFFTLYTPFWNFLYIDAFYIQYLTSIYNQQVFFLKVELSSWYWKSRRIRFRHREPFEEREKKNKENKRKQKALTSSLKWRLVSSCTSQHENFSVCWTMQISWFINDSWLYGIVKCTGDRERERAIVRCWWVSVYFQLNICMFQVLWWWTRIC